LAVNFPETISWFGPILELNMLGWAITFLIVAIVAAVLGFGVVAGTAAWIAKALLVVFLVLFLVSMVAHTRTPAA
jgi:uncharacterized membrane protein YtjA (UPF0391 family)